MRPPRTKELCLAAVLSAAWAPLGCTRASALDPPNVLFIAVDDLNDWIGCLDGHPDASTPNLDRLAARGMLFANAHCAIPLCNPSRVSVMTGLRPTTSGVFTNTDPLRELQPAAVTIPQLFSAHGYRVLGGGKLFHDAYPDPASWDEYFPSQTVCRPPDPLPDQIPLAGFGADLDWGPIDVAAEEMADAQVADWAVAELRREQQQPFFLAVGILRPHLPWYAPREYHQYLDPAGIHLPRVLENDYDDIPFDDARMRQNRRRHRHMVERGLWESAVAAYLTSIRLCDAQIGKLLDALDAGPHAQDTIVVLWSDHGLHLGEKEFWKKKSPWEESTRVPLMIDVPGLAPGRCERAVSLVDLYPTLIELCGLDSAGAGPLQSLDGVSLRALLEDPSAERGRPVLTTVMPAHAVRDDRWRYIRWPDGGEELYDHEQDPDEWHNLAGDPRFVSIKQELGRWVPAGQIVSGSSR